ncbi:MAG: CinA family protein [Clostridia bacterium]|nr:CinA family protein [Clostridia bacterium]
MKEFCGNDNNIACTVLSQLKEAGLCFATAESCTGGLVGQMITALSGSSQVYAGGIISYTNEVKMNVLSVKEETLRNYGAVSRETAAEMSEGALRLTGADIAVSITGIAGPTGAVPGKPVGTVCFGISTKNSTKTYRKEFGENNTRDEIRNMAANFALSLVAEAGKELSYA